MRGNYLLAVIALLAAIGVAAPARADVWSKTYSLTGKPQLTLSAGEGSVAIVPGLQNQIDVHVTTRNWSIGRDVKIVQRQSGNSIEVDVRTPSDSFHFFGAKHSLHVEIDVPRAADLHIRTGDGSISSSLVSGNISLNSGDGSISAQGLSGAMSFQTGDGSIRGLNLDGSVKASSGDGSISLFGRFDSLGIHTGDGSIEASASNGSKVSSSAGWSISSGDGSIHLSLPASFVADLDARSGVGRVTVGFPVTIFGSRSRSSIQGKLGGGGGRLVLRSGVGSITLDRQP